jgi:hypothetical protein
VKGSRFCTCTAKGKISHADIFDPSGFYTLIILLLTKRRYDVIDMDFNRFVGFAQVRKIKIRTNNYWEGKKVN